MSPIRPEHTYNLIEVSAVEIAADGSAVVFVRFPKSSHGFRRSGHPALHVEYLDRMLSWLERYCS